MTMPFLDFCLTFGKPGLLIWGMGHYLIFNLLLVTASRIVISDGHIYGIKTLALAFIVGLFGLASTTMLIAGVYSYTR